MSAELARRAWPPAHGQAALGQIDGDLALRVTGGAGSRENHAIFPGCNAPGIVLLAEGGVSGPNELEVRVKDLDAAWERLVANGTNVETEGEVLRLDPAEACGAANIGEIVAANIETPDKICAGVTPIIMAEPGAAFDLIETARQRPKLSEGLAQCLSKIQSVMKDVNPEGAKAIDALVAAAPAAFQAAYAVALANNAPGDSSTATADAGGGDGGGAADGGSSSGGDSSSSGSSSGGSGTGGGGGSGFSGFAGGGAIGGGGGSGGNFNVPVSPSTP